MPQEDLKKKYPMIGDLLEDLPAPTPGKKLVAPPEGPPDRLDAIMKALLSVGTGALGGAAWGGPSGAAAGALRGALTTSLLGTLFPESVAQQGGSVAGQNLAMSGLQRALPGPAKMVPINLLAGALGAGTGVGAATALGLGQPGQTAGKEALIEGGLTMVGGFLPSLFAKQAARQGARQVSAEILDEAAKKFGFNVNNLGAGPIDEMVLEKTQQLQSVKGSLTNIHEAARNEARVELGVVENEIVRLTRDMKLKGGQHPSVSRFQIDGLKIRRRELNDVIKNTAEVVQTPQTSQLLQEHQKLKFDIGNLQAVGREFGKAPKRPTSWIAREFSDIDAFTKTVGSMTEPQQKDYVNLYFRRQVIDAATEVQKDGSRVLDAQNVVKKLQEATPYLERLSENVTRPVKDFAKIMGQFDPVLGNMPMFSRQFLDYVQKRAAFRLIIGGSPVAGGVVGGSVTGLAYGAGAAIALVPIGHVMHLLFNPKTSSLVMKVMGPASLATSQQKGKAAILSVGKMQEWSNDARELVRLVTEKVKEDGGQVSVVNGVVEIPETGEEAPSPQARLGQFLGR